ncbi:TRAP transporter small permease subunit [Azohydromonas sediminis]|uniref:TRAP transporter small permease subunit n=1 Tax=Azohydromonas sediminis TaxID=2259674 RepID=UPI000E646E40|nr:TRAP transporter small permease subunit [Azohydromonas sediminis]
MNDQPPAGTTPEGGAPLRGPDNGFVAAVERAVDLLGRGAAWLTLAIVLLMATNVLLRYAFSIGSVWAQELEWHLLAPLVLFGMTYALLKGDHVRVDVFYARMAPRGRAAVDLLSALLAVALAVLVIRYSMPYVQQSYAIGEISPDPGGLTHRWLLKALIPLGFGLFGLQAAAQGVTAALRLARAGRS